MRRGFLPVRNAFLAGLLSMFVIQAVCASPKSIDIPEAATAYLETIDATAKRANWPALRAEDLPSGILEVRIWTFGERLPRVLRLRRDWTNWSAFKFDDGGAPDHVKSIAVEPKSGWRSTWQKLLEAGILTLPDASKLAAQSSILDGSSYAIEINNGDIYRIYSFSNPDRQPWPEAGAMSAIVRIVAEEFGVK